MAGRRISRVIVEDIAPPQGLVDESTAGKRRNEASRCPVETTASHPRYASRSLGRGLGRLSCLIHLVPGDPIVQMLGEGATASDISALRHSVPL